MDESERKLGAIRDKYQRLLISIEALKNSLDQEIPAFDEKTLKETVEHIFVLASDIGDDLRELKLR